MKKVLSILILGGVLVFSLAQGTSQVMASEATTGDLVTDSFTQLGRGLVNVVSSPAEIPCNMANDMEGGPWYGFLTGLGKGTVFMVRRMFVGVCEVGTFVIPMEATLPPVCQMSNKK
jgi:putative exosortase-associated protein (TIGR04073 family)